MFNVPQFIDEEDKIIGPLTMKQFFLAIAAGLLVLFFWYSFKLWLAILLSIIVVAAAAATILVKINDRPLPRIAKSWFTYSLRPRVYLWKRK